MDQDEKHDKGERVTYSTDGDGKWWKRISAKRCCHTVFLYGQCQGVDGHLGVHWRYNEGGSFCYSDNENDPQEGGCSGSIPPDHKDYRSPVEMTKFHHGYLGGEYVEVTDPDEIARIEADEFELNESVIRPITDPDRLEKLRLIKEQNDRDAEEFMKGKKK